MTTEQIKDNHYVSFDGTDFFTRYDNPLLLKFEDIFGYLMTYKLQSNGIFDTKTRKSVKSYRKAVTRDICRKCELLDVMDPITLEKEVTDGFLSKIEQTRRTKIMFHNTQRSACNGCRVLCLKRVMTRMSKKK